MGEHVPHEGGGIPFPKTIFEAKPDSRNGIPFIRVTVERADALTLEIVRRDADELKLLRGVAILTAPQLLAEGKRISFRTDFGMPLAGSTIWITSIETFSHGYRVRLEIYAQSQQELDSLIRASR